MKKLILLSGIVLMLMISCNKDNPSANTGDLTVTVYNQQYQFIVGAEVFTSPPTETKVTDQYGSVLIKKIEAGSYEVYATYATGSGKTTVYVNADNLTAVQLNVIEGMELDLAPTVELMLPGLPAEYSDGETITFKALVGDDNTAVTDLNVKWESSLDGVINTDTPDSDGYIQFSRTLSRGAHTITLTVSDSEGYETVKSFAVSTLSPEPLTLYTPVSANGKVTLSWSAYAGDHFGSYGVYRTPADGSTEALLIETIGDASQTTYTDEWPPLVYQAGYYIRLTNAEGYSRNSNEEVVDLPAGPIFNFVAWDMLKHPTEAFVYLVDRGGQKLIKYDYNSHETVTQATLQGTVGISAIGDNGYGVEIYVPSNDGKVYVYDANNLSLSTSILTEKINTSVSIDGAGHMMVALDPSPDAWWTDPLRTFRRDNGMLIDGGGDFDRDISRRIPGTTEFIDISTGVSPIDMDYYKLDANGYFELHSDDPYHGDHPLDPYIFRISDNGEYVITSHSGSVYLANSSMEYKGDLDGGSLYYSDFAFSDDGSVIYAATSNRKSIQVGKYPQLFRTDEIMLSGYPVFIARDGNLLITVSKTTEESVTSGVEVVEIP